MPGTKASKFQMPQSLHDWNFQFKFHGRIQDEIYQKTRVRNLRLVKTVRSFSHLQGFKMLMQGLKLNIFQTDSFQQADGVRIRTRHNELSF